MLTQDIVPMMFFLITGGVLVFWLLTRHKERITMLEKGLKAEDIRALYSRDPNRFTWRPFSSLKWGIIFISVGLAALVGIWLQEVYFVPEGVTFGLMSLFGGIGLIAFYVIAGRKEQQKPAA